MAEIVAPPHFLIDATAYLEDIQETQDVLGDIRNHVVQNDQVEAQNIALIAEVARLQHDFALVLQISAENGQTARRIAAHHNAQLTAFVVKHEFEITALNSEVFALRADNASLRADNASLRAEIASVLADNAALRARVDRLEHSFGRNFVAV